MPSSVMPYRSSSVCPVTARHASSTGVGIAIEPLTISRSERAPAAAAAASASPMAACSRSSSV